MISKPLALLLPSAFCALGAASAETESSHWIEDSLTSKWTVTASFAATNAAVDIVSSEVTLPQEFEEGDFEASLDDDLSISAQLVSGSVGYRLLPFLEVSARAGLASTDTDTGLTISGTPTGVFADVFEGPITFDREATLEVDGYSLGLGAAAYAPLADIGRDKLAGYLEYQYAWNRFDDDTIVSEASRASLGVVFPVNAERGNKPVYRISGSYNWITREIERDLTIGGEPISVRLTQEFENPWSMELGAGLPIADNTLLGLAASHQLSGETSAFASLTFRFE